jgi:hypothetical protein
MMGVWHLIIINSPSCFVPRSGGGVVSSGSEAHGGHAGGTSVHPGRDGSPVENPSAGALASRTGCNITVRRPFLPNSHSSRNGGATNARLPFGRHSQCGGRYSKRDAAPRPCKRSEAIREIENGEWKMENDEAWHFIILHSPCPKPSLPSLVERGRGRGLTEWRRGDCPHNRPSPQTAEGRCPDEQ